MEPGDILDAVSSVGTPNRPVYLVGGAVRDRLLGRKIHDYDFTMVGDSRAAARKIADQIGGAYYPLDEERGTYRVILAVSGEDPVVLDFAMLRAANLEEDLRGRDFTLNALALNLAQPESVIDPMGGVLDLQGRVLRACSPTSISDDPVRSLRAVRMEYSLGLQIDPATRSQILLAPALLKRISAERTRDELFRILDLDQVTEALLRLEEYGLLPVLLPELVALKGMRQSPPHIYPGWEHTLKVVRRLDQIWDLIVNGNFDLIQKEPVFLPVQEILGRFQQHLSSHYENWLVPLRSPHSLLTFSALYHDCAKPKTLSTDPDGRIRFFNHDQLGAKVAAQRARRLALSADEVEGIESIIAGHMRIHQLADARLSPSPRSIYRYFRDTRRSGIDICLLSLADTMGTYGDTLPTDHWLDEIRTVAILMSAYWDQPAKIVSPVRLINGNDLIQELGMEPGPRIGKILEAVREAQAAGEVANRAEAFTLAQQMLNEV